MKRKTSSHLGRNPVKKKPLPKKAKRCCCHRNRPAGCCRDLSWTATADCRWPRARRPSRRSAPGRRGEEKLETPNFNLQRIISPRFQQRADPAIQTHQDSRIVRPGVIFGSWNWAFWGILGLVIWSVPAASLAQNPPPRDPLMSLLLSQPPV